MSIKRPRFQHGSLRLATTGWWLRYRNADGREATRFVGPRSRYRTKAAARMACDKFMAEINPGHAVSSRSVTLGAFAPVYLSDSIALLKPSSQSAAKSILQKHIVPLLGERYLEDVGVQQQQQLVNRLHADGLSNKTIINALGIVSRLSSLARKYGHPVSPFDRRAVTLPPDALDRTRRYFTPAEVRQILAAAEMPWRALYALFAYLGLRTGEGLGLCWSHINFDQQLIHIRQSAVLGRVQTVKSRNSKADLPMPAPLLELLRAHQQQWAANEAGLLFADEDGQPLNANRIREAHFGPLLKRLGLPHGGFHAFRHGAATNLLSVGVPIHTVKAILRHGDIKTTLTYSHTTTDDQRRATDKTSDLFIGGITRDANA